jgi:integrase
MPYNALSQLSARSLPKGKHADGQGLWLVKRDKQFGKWTLRLVVSGKRREMGLGRWPDVSIAEARHRAEAARKFLRHGIDPVAQRQKAQRVIHKLSIKEAVALCFEAKKAEMKRDGEAGRWMSPLSTLIIPKFGSLPVEDVDQHALRSMLEPHWHVRSDPARKALNRINLTLKHAAALGLDVDLQATMKVKALLGKQRHEVTHIPALPFADLPTFYTRLRKTDGIAALALRFLILTVGRTSEVRLLKEEEIVNDVWHLPAARAKTNRERKIPLTREALAVLCIARVTGGEYIFASPTGKALSDAGMSALMKRLGMRARPHGFRATFRTWAEDNTDASFEVKESALGHTVGSDVVRAYQRSDYFEQRQSLLQKWETFVVGPV